MTVIDFISSEQGVTETQSRPAVRVWDLPVRLFHWTLVLAVIGAFVTNRLGESYFKYHEFCGYTVLVAVTFRLIWGVLGTHHARFVSFLRSPVQTFRYARALAQGRPVHYSGHNPLGALMVVALLGLLGVHAVLGLFANDEILNVGPLYGYVSNDLSLVLTSLHRRGFYVLAALVAVHVAAVLFHQIVHKESLIRAMITGWKPPASYVDGAEVRSSRLPLAAGVVVALAGVLAWLILTAPAADTLASF